MLSDHRKPCGRKPGWCAQQGLGGRATCKAPVSCPCRAGEGRERPIKASRARRSRISDSHEPRRAEGRTQDTDGGWAGDGGGGGRALAWGSDRKKKSIFVPALAATCLAVGVPTGRQGAEATALEQPAWRGRECRGASTEACSRRAWRRVQRPANMPRLVGERALEGVPQARRRSVAFCLRDVGFHPQRARASPHGTR